MFRKFLLFAALVFLTGCATTKGPAQTTQLQMRVSELERQIEDKDEEIKNLNFQIKDMSYEMDKTRGGRRVQAESDAGTSEEKGEIIRVAVGANQVQRALKNAGFYQGKVDGKVGAKTKKAISDFQRENGLKADGLVGRQTWTALKPYLNQE